MSVEHRRCLQASHDRVVWVLAIRRTSNTCVSFATAALSSRLSAYLMRILQDLDEVQSPNASASSGWVSFISARVGILLRREYDEKISASFMPRPFASTDRLAVWNCARDRGLPLLYISPKGGSLAPLGRLTQLSQTHLPTSAPVGPWRGHAHL